MYTCRYIRLLKNKNNDERFIADWYYSLAVLLVSFLLSLVVFYSNKWLIIVGKLLNVENCWWLALSLIFVSNKS